MLSHEKKWIVCSSGSTLKNSIAAPDKGTLIKFGTTPRIGIISEEIIVEDVKDEQEKVSEPKEFQSAEEIIYGEQYNSTSEK